MKKVSNTDRQIVEFVADILSTAHADAAEAESIERGDAFDCAVVDRIVTIALDAAGKRGQERRILDLIERRPGQRRPASSARSVRASSP